MFWRKATFTHAGVFFCISAILRKQNFANIALFILIRVQDPVITTTEAKLKSKNKMDRIPRVAIQRIDLLTPSIHFLPFPERSKK